MIISFVPLNHLHFPLLYKWLEKPHVKMWYDKNVTYTMDLVQVKYGSYVSGYKLVNGLRKAMRSFIIFCDKNAIGYIQIYDAYEFPRGYQLLGLPKNLGSIDVLVGEEEFLKIGLGSRVISEFIKVYGKDYEHILVDPDSINMAAIKCFNKVGFRRLSHLIPSNKVCMLWSKND